MSEKSCFDKAMSKWVQNKMIPDYDLANLDRIFIKFIFRAEGARVDRARFQNPKSQTKG